MSKNKANNNLLRLSWSLAKLIREYSATEAFTAEKVIVGLMLKIQKDKNLRDLMFVNFGKPTEYIRLANDIRVNANIFFYVSELFTRTIQPGHETISSQHKLYLELLRYSMDPRWHDAKLARIDQPVSMIFNQEESTIIDPDGDSTTTSSFKITVISGREAFFRPVADKAEKLAEKQRPSYSTLVKSLREKQGILMLKVGSNQVEMPEVINLAHVLDLLPMPLALAGVNINQLIKVLDTVNREYGFLYAIGLDPKEWLGKFADNQLRTLSQMIKRIKELVNNQYLDKREACQQAFNELIADKKHSSLLVNYFNSEPDGFYAFYTTEIKPGIFFVNPYLVPSNEDDDPSEGIFGPDYDQDTDEEHESDLTKNLNFIKSARLDFLHQNTELFNTVLEALWIIFSEAICDNEYNIEVAKLIKSHEFKLMISNESEYSGLSDRDLLNRIKQQIDDLENQFIQINGGAE